MASKPFIKDDSPSLFFALAARDPDILDVARLALKHPANTWFQVAYCLIPHFGAHMRESVEQMSIAPALRRSLRFYEPNFIQLIRSQSPRWTIPERAGLVELAVEDLDLFDQPFGLVDIGCGPPFMTLRIADLFPNAKVIGLDPAPLDFHIR